MTGRAPWRLLETRVATRAARVGSRMESWTFCSSCRVVSLLPAPRLPAYPPCHPVAPTAPTLPASQRTSSGTPIVACRGARQSQRLGAATLRRCAEAAPVLANRVPRPPRSRPRNRPPVFQKLHQATIGRPSNLPSVSIPHRATRASCAGP